MMKHINLNDLIEENLRDPSFTEEFEKQEIINYISAMVYKARKSSNLTQTELAEKSGTTQPVIARLESGNDSRTPSFELLSRIATATNSKIDFKFSPNRRPNMSFKNDFQNHKQEGKKLIPPMLQLNTKYSLISWERNICPEFLWIYDLIVNYKDDSVKIYNHVVDILDKFIPPNKEIATGMISDFGLLNELQQKEFLAELNEAKLVEKAFTENFLKFCFIYSGSPVGWLSDLRKFTMSPSFQSETIKYLCDSISELKDKYCKNTALSICYPINRYFLHGKIMLNADNEHLSHLSKIIPHYPYCSDEDNKQVEQFARMQINMRRSMNSTDWSSIFWNIAFELTPCFLNEEDCSNSDQQEDLKLTKKTLTEVLESIRTKIKDFYSSIERYVETVENEDVLLGLLQRNFMLTSLLTETENLWYSYSGQIYLRAILDSRILLEWLVKNYNEPDLFLKFKKFALANEKLVALHIKSKTDKESISDEEKERFKELFENTKKNISSEFLDELLEIDLGNWNDKSIRQMAKEIKQEELYKIIYQPLSSAVHGEWSALRDCHLKQCDNPLHITHWIPTFKGLPKHNNSVGLSIKFLLDSIFILSTFYGCEIEESFYDQIYSRVQKELKL